MKRRIQYFGSIAAVKKQSLFLGITAIILGAAVIGSMAMPVSALDYQKTINVGFNVQDTLTVSLSSPNLIIDDLMPGTASDSNIITVNVLSNNPYGYTLTSTVGNETTYNNRNLTNTTAASSTPFASLDYGSSVASLTTDNTWGYSYSDQTVATPTWTAYSGLPLYSDTTNIATLKESTTTSAASGDNIQFKIAAKASDTQLAGEYKNIINFILTGAPTPPSKIYMQTMTADQCVTDSPTTAYDSRDEEEYKIQRLADGKCWMLDNLRLDPANSTTLNNITESNTHASATTLNYFKNGGGTTSDQYPTAKINNVAWTSSSQNYYSVPMTINTYKDTTTTSYGAGSGKIGVYYNYCAASAGSYCYGNGTSAGTSTGNATEDLCPSGWRMPGGSSTINLTANPPTGEFQNLYNYYSTTQTATDTNSLQYNLSLPLSGFFGDGSAYDQGSNGGWWSSTRSSNRSMYNLYVNASNVNPADYSNRSYGNSLRCVAQ